MEDNFVTCTKCKTPFLYIVLNNHLCTAVAWDPATNEPNSFVFQCQECYDKETTEIILFIQEKTDSRGWSNAVYFAEKLYGEESVNRVIESFYEKRKKT